MRGNERERGCAASTLWGHGVSVCPSERPGATRSRTSCLISLISGKRPPLLPRPDDLVVNAHLKDAAGPIRGESHGAELFGKRGQQLLRHPARPQTPAA